MDEEGNRKEILELKKLLEETLDVAEENNRILKRMERNALLGFIAKVVLWLLLLGVPLLFLGSYLGPLMSMLPGGATGTSTAPASVFGLPSAAQLQQIMDTYNPNSQP